MTESYAVSGPTLANVSVRAAEITHVVEVADKSCILLQKLLFKRGESCLAV